MAKSDRRSSLLRKVFVVISLMMLLPALVFTYFSNRITTDSLMEKKRQNDLRTIRELSTRLDETRGALEDIAALIGGMEPARQAFWGDASETESFTRRCARALSGVAAVSLLDARGHFIRETRLDPGRLSWFFNPSLLRKLSGDGALWTDPFTIAERETGAQYRVQALIAPVADEAGALSGYVVLYYETENLRAMVRETGEELYVLDASQCIVASQENIPHYIGLYDFTRVSFTLLLEDVSAIVSVEQERKFVTTQKYAPMNLQFVMLSPFDSISDEMAQYYTKFILMGVACALFALTAALFIARFFTKPIFRLKRLMDRATGGDLAVRYVSDANDEVDQLGRAFNQSLDTIQQLMRQKIDEQKMKRRLQLQLLQEQVRPHFLYNVLEMISSLVQCGMSREALGAIQALARFYRISLSSGSDIISIGQEITLTESYLALQKLRYIEFMDYKVAIDPNLLTFSIPKLTLQPLVENAIYHGLKAKRPKGVLSVSGALAGDRVVFEVYDSGQGMDERRLSELRASLLSPEGACAATHFGLGSVIRRLNLFCGGAQMDIDSRCWEYTSVRISFPAIPLKPVNHPPKE